MIYLTSILNVNLREEAEEMPVLIKSMFYFILWCDNFNRGHLRTFSQSETTPLTKNHFSSFCLKGKGPLLSLLLR